jgi:hypothetical protein
MLFRELVPIGIACSSRSSSPSVSHSSLTFTPQMTIKWDRPASIGRHRKESMQPCPQLGGDAIFPSAVWDDKMQTSIHSCPPTLAPFPRNTFVLARNTTPKNRCSTHPGDEDASRCMRIGVCRIKTHSLLISNEVGRKMISCLKRASQDPRFREKKMVRCALNAKHVAHAGYQCTLLNLPTSGRQSIIRWSNHIMLYR